MVHRGTTIATTIKLIPPPIGSLGSSRRGGSGHTAADGDDQLVTAARTGQLDAFNVLVMRYERAAYGLAVRLLTDRAAAEDITQESLLSAWSNLASYRGDRFRSWLLRIVANRCYDELRRRQRHLFNSLDALPVEPAGEWTIQAPAEAPDAYALRRELRHHLNLGIASLPPDLRLTLILSDVQGYSYEEIATITGVNLGTVKSRLSRARARLRDVMRRYLPAGARPGSAAADPRLAAG